MVTGKKIIWHPDAKSELFDILDFYTTRNGSSEYSDRLFGKIEYRLSLISDDCQLGEKINKENVRRTTVEYFVIHYLITLDSVEVLSIRDGRRKPQPFKFNK